MSRSVITVPNAPSPTTPAATATAPSVSRPLVIAGWPSAPKNYCPVPYCHLVFTVPQGLAPLARQNQRWFYSLLFRAVSKTLLEIAADPRHLGARIGFPAVLHTWGQNSLHHPHLHCVVPAGGMALDGSRWIACRRKFFLPVRVLSRVFRGKLLAFLADAYSQKRAPLPGTGEDSG